MGYFACQMKGYATFENAKRAAEKYLIGRDDMIKKCNSWFIIAKEDGRFVPALSLGQSPGGPGPWFGGPFLLMN